MMDVHTYRDAREFLRAAGDMLESREALNSLMLGVCGQMMEHPERFPPPICLKTVEIGGVLDLAAVMIPPNRLLIAGPGGGEECAKSLADSLAGEGWRIPGVVGPDALARNMIVPLAAAAGKQYRLERRLRLYDLEKVETPIPSRGRLKQAGAADAEWISRWWYEARVEMVGRARPEEARRTAGYRLEDGEVYFWEDAEPVCMASITRRTRRGICVGMVYTPPEFRNRGYATACVGELCRKVLQEGRGFCVLFADLMYPAPNRIYRKIGFRPIGDYEEYGSVEED